MSFVLVSFFATAHFYKKKIEPYEKDQEGLLQKKSTCLR